jgi:outer membrane protein assembly factor BamB
VPGLLLRAVGLAATALIAAPVVASPAGAVASWPGPRPMLSDWPQFQRGYYHDGHSEGGTAPNATQVATLHSDWTATGSSTANASGSPIVVNDAVYTGGGGLASRDVRTGALRWRSSVTGVQTTPAYDHGTVVVVAANAVVAVTAANGRVLWRHPLAGTASSSPTILDHRVFVGYRTASSYVVAAFGLADGSSLWTHSEDVTGTPGSVGSPSTDGKAVYASFGGGAAVVALDVATGAQKWSRVLDGAQSANVVDGYSTVVFRAVVYLGTSAGSVWALDRSNGATVWRSSAGQPVKRPLTATPTAIFALPAGAAQSIVGFSPVDGHRVWSYGPVATGSICVANGVLYTGNVAGGAAAVDALKLSDGHLVKRVTLSGTGTPTGPVISNSRVYVAYGSRLAALAP